MISVVVLHQGDPYSTTLLYDVLRVWRPEFTAALRINYGQRHVRELQAAASLCDLLAVPHFELDLLGLLPAFAGSALTDTTVPVPDGFSEEALLGTYVPNRNMLMLSVAVAWALALQAAEVYVPIQSVGIVQPDTRVPFVQAMQAAALQCAASPGIVLKAPYLLLSKEQIIARGQQSGVPFALTYSCYRNMTPHCGTCGSCVARQLAFRAAGVQDPIEYVASAEP